MEDTREYLNRKLNSNLFNLKSVARESKISLRTVMNLKNNPEHKSTHAIKETLANFLKSIGE